MDDIAAIRSKTPRLRREFGSDIVHFRNDCPHWPATKYVVLPGAPNRELFCPACLAMGRGGRV